MERIRWEQAKGARVLLSDLGEGAVEANRGMSAADRREAIVELLIAQQRAGIGELAALFGVSHMTIRRDLEKLSAERRVTVGRGEARFSQYNGVEPDYAVKQGTNALLKAQLARYAAENFVSDGDVIVLEGGTTVTAMARYLDGRERLTVITNGMYTTSELAWLLPAATVICTGGVLRGTSFTYVGPQVDDMLAGIHAHTLFMSATGFTVEHGLTDPNPLEVQTRKHMAQCAERVVALIDSSKFGVVSMLQSARTQDVDVFITNADAPSHDIALIRRAGVDVRLV